MVMATRFVASSLNKVWVSVPACANPNLRPRSAELTPPLEIMVCNPIPVLESAGNKTWRVKFPAPITLQEICDKGPRLIVCRLIDLTRSLDFKAEFLEGYSINIPTPSLPPTVS